jgi:hypothetical protein
VEANFLEERVNSLRVGEEAIVYGVSIPLNEDIAKVKDDGCDGGIHLLY